jgi:hypothetical protein
MKKRILAPALVLGVVSAADAGAVPPTSAPAPTAIRRFFATNVTGTIDVSALKTDAFAGFKCSDIVLGVQSVEQVGAPGAIKVPKWTRYANATGTLSSGTCAYTIPVPGKSAFFFSTLQGSGPYDCDIITLATSSFPSGILTVAFGAAKSENFTVTAMGCENQT